MSSVCARVVPPLIQPRWDPMTFCGLLDPGDSAESRRTRNSLLNTIIPPQEMDPEFALHGSRIARRPHGQLVVWITFLHYIVG